MNIIHRPEWIIPEREATPEDVFFNRRRFMKGLGAVGLGLAAGGGGLVSSVFAQEGKDPTLDLYPAKQNPDFTLKRAITPESVTSVYNNFYEFGSHKRISGAAQALKIRPWAITIDGLVDNPQTIDFDDLVRKMPLQERLYRHRCVEAWAMAVPWTGFPLAELVKYAGPQNGAKYIRFETFEDSDVASGQRQFWYPWPYVEGVTMDEAMNDLAFVATGIYGKPLLKQYGAPIRLVMPWKYGFKSIKSIVKITFTDERPVSFWEKIGPSEYGFWANVNPEVPHARWSQATERLLGTDERVPTQLFNGYAEQVAHLYKDLQGQDLYK
ncbi:sulfite oxidase subunit YedY [Pseudovibrio sp. FO-BEG1]|uniref:Protein-methionine-sulfoxide reductase catalytic subunit MsrP n=2 Tax=Pseudovibrio TaxID=258255 RepID=A0A1I6ZBV4_9HYPH|nr:MULTISPECIES: protein-methionine-sulfoxide reductase catalytic subunit MsrP [Pseudovibrio]AEV38876.1 sulfite oxidase subunit YedY [Pseudovibrio sp. FO-BEG1]QUS54955.1 protein-methionine-sulfoxide reductase catalytic subunit MsrP [Pseudovibrio brasiliensis]SFT60180.1 sulfoxide reductase catalytic subunit YedY [Pseudovibrio denitrificans]